MKIQHLASFNGQFQSKPVSPLFAGQLPPLLIEGKAITPTNLCQKREELQTPVCTEAGKRVRYGNEDLTRLRLLELVDEVGQTNLKSWQNNLKKMISPVLLPTFAIVRLKTAIWRGGEQGLKVDAFFTDSLPNQKPVASMSQILALFPQEEEKAVVQKAIQSLSEDTYLRNADRSYNRRREIFALSDLARQVLVSESEETGC